MNENYPITTRGIRVGLAAAAAVLGSVTGTQAQVFFDFEESTGGWINRAINATAIQEQQPDLATSGSGVLAVNSAGTGGWHEAANVILQPNHPGYLAITEAQNAATPMVLAFDIILTPDNDGGYLQRSNPWFNVNFRIEAGAGTDFRTTFNQVGDIGTWPEATSTYTAEIPVEEIPVSPGSPMTLILIFDNNGASNFTVYLDNFRVVEPGEDPGPSEGPVAEAMAFFDVTTHTDYWIVLPETMGWLEIQYFPWVYSMVHEWLFLFPEETFMGGAWFYEINTGDWWRTSANPSGGYPWLYSASRGWVLAEGAGTGG